MISKLKGIIEDKDNIIKKMNETTKVTERSENNKFKLNNIYI